MKMPIPRRLVPALLLAALGAGGVPPAAAQGANEAESRFNAGVSHLREGRSALALEEFKKAVSKEPKNPYFHKGLGQAYAAQRRYKEAVDAFRKALALNPYYVDVRNDLGMALISTGRREEGKKEFLTAFNDPTNPAPELTSWNLGSAYLDEKDYKEAAEWFRTSLKRSKSAPAYYGLATALKRLGSNDEATAQLEAGVQEFPDNATLLLTLGEAYYHAGRFGEARDRLDAASRKDAGAVGKRATELLKHFPH